MQREKSADPDIQLVCDDSNIFKWTALIKVSYFIPFFLNKEFTIVPHFNNDKIAVVFFPCQV